MNYIIEQDKEWIDTVWDKMDKKLRYTAVKNRDKLPFESINGVYSDEKEERITWWTNGFWGGIMWLMYEATGNEEYRKTAERSEEILDGAFKEYKMLHHDVGFMWQLTSCAGYRLLGKKDSCNRSLIAAASLSSRYNLDGDYIRAWNGTSYTKDPREAAGFTIIDCLMNLALLYWASEEIEDERFKKIAMRHMDMAIRDHIRPDGSVYHIVCHEVNQVGVRKVFAGQSYSEDSCWSRGLAWAVYGSVISYIHTGKAEYKEAFKKTSAYFLEQCRKTEYLPLIDFCAPSEPVYYDSSAGLCVACALLEMAKHVLLEEARYYTQEALKLLKVCDEKCCNYDLGEDALVTMCGRRYPKNDKEVEQYTNKNIIFGDFFFVEAMCKLKGRDFFIW
ncbi:MAG: glycoside hydrolase family 88 protein [Lachnospiraceae bacterium]|nr:glycoside hydrolase family 88 protein [Lachnospiraceae bacterium]